MSEYKMSHTGSELDEAIRKVNEGYIDSSGTTAEANDIYQGKTAWVNGELITGAYGATPAGGSQYNCNSANCSASTLVIPCFFEPRYVCVILNSGTHSTNTIIAAMFMLNAVVYHSRTSSGVTRNQITENIGNYWSWDSNNKQLILKQPNTSYSWSTYNYRIFAFK